MMVMMMVVIKKKMIIMATVNSDYGDQDCDSFGGGDHRIVW